MLLSCIFARVDGVLRTLVHRALQLSRCSHYSQLYRASARIRAQACRNVLYIRVAQNNWRARPKPSRISGIFRFATRVTVLKPTARFRDHARRLCCFSWPVGRARERQLWTQSTCSTRDVVATRDSVAHVQPDAAEHTAALDEPGRGDAHRCVARVPDGGRPSPL